MKTIITFLVSMILCSVILIFYKYDLVSFMIGCFVLAFGIIFDKIINTKKKIK